MSFLVQHERLKMSIVAAIFAAITAIFAQIIIPLPLIPITGQTFAIGLAITVLGLHYGTISVLLYILLGAVGLPVFSGMTGGLGIIFGPTGGYIIGFLAQAIVMGIYFNVFGTTKTHSIISNLIGMVVTLVFGMIWLKYWGHLTWSAAFIGGVVPFLFVGIVKAVLAGFIGLVLRHRLVRLKLLPTRTQHT